MKYLLFAFILFTAILSAQDFGFEVANLSDFRSLSIGYHTQDFRPAGGNTASDSDRIAFSTPMPMLEFRQLSGRLAAGYQTFTDIDGKKRGAFSVYGESQTDLPIIGGGRNGNGLIIPFCLAVNYLRAESPTSKLKAMDVGSIGPGAGLKYRYLERSFGVQASVTGTLLYASEGFSTGYGNQVCVNGEVLVLLPELVLEGMVVGYRFERQQWNMNNNAYDYRRMYHGIDIGFMF